MARFLLKRGMAQGGADVAAPLEAMVRRIARLGEEDSVSVTEIACAHPDCGDGETILLIMRLGKKTEAVKITKAMRLVSEEDVAHALHAAGVLP